MRAQEVGIGHMSYFLCKLRCQLERCGNGISYNLFFFSITEKLVTIFARVIINYIIHKRSATCCRIS